ncbi:UvrD-helicase domain-containing protein [Massilia norwichensis]|uniref:DNA 3'-5' helicase n=1 Tax=Massilia norwichensis TaxID=1442366 RepID=A0ABT2A358_9BURK|nr:ATP-dependent helicase [Massilia norwichensis]MCS0588613.1 ATP-dependent helicase [Massilia norwichensis]
MSTQANSQQAAILQSPHKVKLIAAVAGAGKTTTLAMEARQARDDGLSERGILALCFSRGARLRFHEKLKEEAGEDSSVFVMTVEDFARQLIEDLAERGRITRPVAHADVEGIRGELVAAAARVWQRYQEQGVRSDFNFGLDENNQHLDDIARRLAQLKAALATGEFAPKDNENFAEENDDDADYDESGDGELAGQPDPIADIIREYEAARHPYPDDFRWQGPNDAVADLVYLLQRQPSLAQELRRWSLYLVDEWHDVNAAEFELLARLRRGARLVVAGDKDQTINRERGADPVFSGQRFTDAYRADGKRFPLGMSYRFGPDAAALADRLTHNGCEGRPDRATNVRRVAYDPAQPGACARLVADTIREALQKGRPKPSNRDFAVVLRDVDQSIEIETALMEAKIPYKCDGFETFLLLPEILLLRGVLHYACGDYTALKGHAETCVQMVLALSRYFYLTRDPRHWNLEGAGRRSVLGYAQDEVRRTPEVLQSFFDGALLRETEFDSPQARQSKNLIRPVIAKMASLSPTATAYELLTMLREEVDLHDATSRAFVSRDRVVSARRSIDAFLRFASTHGQVPAAEFLARLTQMENDVALVRKSKNANSIGTRRSLVRVTTIQAAKGREWPYVLVPFLQQDEFVRTRDATNELRHLYVGLTRVMKELVLFEPDAASAGRRLAYLNS